jgi:hypothetical protein
MWGKFLVGGQVMDYDDPLVDERWCNERRDDVIAYLQQEQVAHGEVGESPAWHIAPYVSIWAIESKLNPSWVGWWVICGDLPTDYVSSGSIKNPRDAIRAIADRWRTAAEQMARGHSSPDFSIGSPTDWTTLAPQLASRAELLADWAADQELWVDL